MRRKQGRVIIYLLVILLICLAPFWVANYILKHHHDLALHKNVHGFLYHVPPDIEGFPSFERRSSSRHWSLLYITKGCCKSQACQNNAYNLRASRGILVKDERLFQSYIAMPNDCQARGLSHKLFKDDSVHPIFYSDHQLEELKKKIKQAAHSIDWVDDQLFIVDPFEKVVLHYPGDGAPTDWLQDFKLLLKVGFNE